MFKFSLCTIKYIFYLFAKVTHAKKDEVYIEDTIINRKS